MENQNKSALEEEKAPLLENEHSQGQSIDEDRLHVRKPKGRNGQASATQSVMSNATNRGFLNKLLEGDHVCAHLFIVQRPLSQKTALVYNQQINQQFVIRSAQPEDLGYYHLIEMSPHSNIVTVFDQIEHLNEKYFVCEHVESGTITGNVYELIHGFSYDLQERVPRRYIKLLYEFIIQMCNAFTFAHENNLIHGDFKLRNVVVKKFNRRKVLFKVKAFRNPSKKFKLNEIDFIPQNQAKALDLEDDQIHKQLQKLRDINSLGVSIIEFMCNKSRSSSKMLSLEDLPMQWADMPESLCIIETIVECLSFTNIKDSTEKLPQIKAKVISEYEAIFNKDYFDYDYPQKLFKHEKTSSTSSDSIVLKKHLIGYLQGKFGDSQTLLNKALDHEEAQIDALLNHQFFLWCNGLIADHEIISFLSQDFMKNRVKLDAILAVFRFAMGDPRTALELIQTQVFKNQPQISTLDQSFIDQELLYVMQHMKIYLEDKSVPLFQNKKLDLPDKILFLHQNDKYVSVATSKSFYIYKIDQASRDIVKRASILPQIKESSLKEADDQIRAIGMSDDGKKCLYVSDTTLQVYTIEELKEDSHWEQLSPNEELDIFENLKLQLKSVTSLGFEVLKLQNYSSEVAFICDDKQKYYISFDLKQVVSTADLEKEDKKITDSLQKIEQAARKEKAKAFIKKQQQAHNRVKFGDGIIVAYDNEEKSFGLYNISKGKVYRKFLGYVEEESDQTQAVMTEGDEAHMVTAFEISPDQKFISYTYDNTLVMRSLVFPEFCHKFLSPLYYSYDDHSIIEAMLKYHHLPDLKLSQIQLQSGMETLNQLPKKKPKGAALQAQNISKSKALIKVADAIDDFILFPEIAAADKKGLKELQYFVKQREAGDLEKRAMGGFSQIGIVKCERGSQVLRVEIDNESFLLFLVYKHQIQIHDFIAHTLHTTLTGVFDSLISLQVVESLKTDQVTFLILLPSKLIKYSVSLTGNHECKEVKRHELEFVPRHMQVSSFNGGNKILLHSKDRVLVLNESDFKHDFEITASKIQADGKEIKGFIESFMSMDVDASQGSQMDVLVSTDSGHLLKYKLSQSSKFDTLLNQSKESDSILAVCMLPKTKNIIYATHNCLTMIKPDASESRRKLFDSHNVISISSEQMESFIFVYKENSQIQIHSRENNLKYLYLFNPHLPQPDSLYCFDRNFVFLAKENQDFGHIDVLLLKWEFSIKKYIDPNWRQVRQQSKETEGNTKGSRRGSKLKQTGNGEVNAVGMRQKTACCDIF